MADWNRKDVERWLVQAEKADARVRNPGESRPLRWPDRFVDTPEEREALKLWVWCGARGYAFHEICKRRGHPYSTWLDRKNRAVLRIVMFLNLEASLQSTGHLVAAEP